jgi:hypothetical protein
MASFHRVFGHPHYGGNGEEPTHREFTLQHTDYKSVEAYRKFSGDNAWNPRPEIAANGQRCARENFLKGERGHTMFLVVPRALPPTKRGNVWGPGTACACYFVGSIKCS